MEFVRVNEHMVKCVIDEQEMTEMGYRIEEICQDQELASEFIRKVIEKANEDGFDISEDIHMVQAMYVPEHQLILNFMDAAMESHMESAIEQMLKAFDLIDVVGKERLEDIFHLKGEEQKQAFRECIEKVAPTEELSLDEENTPAMEGKEEPKGNASYLLKFRDFELTECFCKKAPAVVPGRLYKTNGTYFLLTDLSTLEEKERKNFLLFASEYSEAIQKDNLTSDYLEEHADIVIAHTPVEILKQL